MTEIRDAAITFEAVKTSLNQNKDGMILRLAIHPNDIPRQIMTDWVGSRYQVAMVKLGDDDQPEIDPATVIAERAVKSAGMLCRNDAFHRFLVAERYSTETEIPERDADRWAAGVMRNILGVDSRADLKGSPEALEAFRELQEQFLAWRQRNPHEAKTERRHGQDT